MIATLGMSDTLGHIGQDLNDNTFNKPFSSKTNELIDLEVKEMIEICQNKAKALVIEKKEFVTKLSERLLEKETIILSDLQEILGPREHELTAEMNE